VENYRAEYGLEYTILRYGSLYGPRADMRNGIYRFVREAMESGTITYYGTSRALREYIHVNDAADCTVEILGPDFANKNIVLTGSQPMRITDLFTMIAEMLGRKVEFIYQDDTENRHYEMTPYSFNPKIGYKMTPRLSTDLGQGILATIEDIYRDTHQNATTVENYLIASENNS
jgi:UDP-glucose 4-epimerase